MGDNSQEGEAQLVKSLSNSNLLAFNTLFKKYSGRLFRFANFYLKCEAESEDLVQEVFMCIWENRQGLKYDLSFKSYIFTIAFNIIKKRFRKRSHMKEYLTSKIYSDLDMQTSERIIYDSLYKYLVNIVDQLPNRRKEVFIKSRFEGLTIKEISEELKISHKTVENHLTDALKFLRFNLKNEQITYVLFFSCSLFF